jgi:translation initiation factor 2B subunit (eIF-2B alpha/beta/delta family)
METIILNDILNDNISGSSELLTKINDLLIRNIDDKKSIQEILNNIKSKMKNFEIVLRYSEKVQKLLNHEDKKTLKEYLYRYKSESLDSFQNIYRNLAPSIIKKKIIFTLSNSQTVFEVLRFWKNENRSIKVIIAESRPVFEGRILAKKLLIAGIKTVLITDSQISNYISKCDCVLIGCDKILKNKDVVNKTGSKSAAIIAGYYKKPVYVITSSNKFSRQINFKPAIHNYSEIWNYRHSKLKIENNYLEVVPNNLISKIITEKAVYDNKC